MTPEQAQMLQEMHQAMVGNEKLGISGLINDHRQFKDKANKKFEDIEQKLWYYAGACAGAMFIFGAIFTVIQTLRK